MADTYKILQDPVTETMMKMKQIKSRNSRHRHCSRDELQITVFMVLTKTCLNQRHSSDHLVHITFIEGNTHQAGQSYVRPTFSVSVISKSQNRPRYYTMRRAFHIHKTRAHPGKPATR